jgi:excisionase family DNA binding protein
VLNSVIRAQIFLRCYIFLGVKIMDLAARLGINRVSFARIARTGGVPGLERTPKNRWHVHDRRAFEEFAKRYRSRSEKRLAQLSQFNDSKVKQLESGIRFHRERFPSETEILLKTQKAIDRMRSAETGETYTTTELAKLLGVTSQTIRNLRNEIPGAKVVGQRLKFEKTPALETYVRSKLAAWAVHSRTARRKPPQR